MTTVTDYLIQLQDLTKKNLEILQGINDSFFTKQNHLGINVGNTKYIIPSYIALENKINMLEEGFNNLIHAPKTGEAFFNFDGNSRAIEVRSYTNTPASIKLDEISNFDYETNNIFKDFLTPKPFIKFSLKEIPNDITSVNVKKIIPINKELINNIFVINDSNEQKASKSYTYSDLYKALSLYKKDIDYIEYDTIEKLPIRKNIGHATYVIEKIINDITSETLDEYVTLKLRTSFDSYIKENYTTNLSYKLFNETIDVPLVVGDKLVTYDGNAQMEITKIMYNTNTIEVKILHGDYTNFVESNKDSAISDYSKIRFYSPINFDEDKYIKVPLEEDRYIFVAIAPLNERMNIQSSWGSGLIIDTNNLYKNTVKSSTEDKNISFKEYYQNNVNNIGDTLFELTSIATNGITKYSKPQYEAFSKLKPVINLDDIKVTQINNHLNDSETVKNIKALYAQKISLNNSLAEIQKNISDSEEILSKNNYDDTTGRRADIETKINNWNAEKNEKVTAINKVINQISLAASNSDISIENAKFGIRGFFDFTPVINKLKDFIPNIEKHLLGIKVQYRYKNSNKSQGSAMSINDKFIFSDWNDMKGFKNPRIPVYNENGISFKLADLNNNENAPSCNQIDIPISQGETVDIKLKVIYDFGAPYIETTSDWSDIVNVEFPIEFTKDIQVLDIIKENNDDIETNRFNNILLDTGVCAHIDDKLVDQDLTYFHKPENISSGFVTPDTRRIIPLKDKLIDMNNIITELNDIVKGSVSESLEINIVNGKTINKLNPWQNNIINVNAYNSFNVGVGINTTDGVYDTDEYLISTKLDISITNISKHIVNLYSMFPGNKDININDLKHTKYDISDYAMNKDYGVWICNNNISAPDKEAKDESYKLRLQTANQFITFRIKSIGTNIDLYDKHNSIEDAVNKNTLAYNKELVLAPNTARTETEKGMWVYPLITDQNNLLINNINNSLANSIKPGEQIIIPIMVQYNLNNAENADFLKKTLSFDLRTSLYTDPINYEFTIIAKYIDTIQDKILSNHKNSNNKYIPSI